MRCLKLYKNFWFEITKDIRAKTIKYIPFWDEDDLDIIIQIIWDKNLKKDEIDYLLSIYDWTRIKDDLMYHNINTFIIFYNKYKKRLIK